MKQCIDCNNEITLSNQKLGHGKVKGKTYITQRCKFCYANYRKKYKVAIKCNHCKELFEIAKQRFNQNWICIKCRKSGITKIKVNHYYFSEINDNSSYWAGFIAADGCIRNDVLVITLNAVDKCQLIDFVNAIKYKGKIYEVNYFHNQIQKNVSHVSVTIKSGKICQDLNNNFKITAKKSLTLEPPDLNLTNALAFIKGYIDGDGCIYINKQGIKLQILGTVNIINWILKICQNFYSCGSINKKSSCSQVRFSGFGLMKILPHIHNSVNFGLQRKWNKFTNHNRIYKETRKLNNVQFFKKLV
jgi:hypothetical protein